MQLGRFNGTANFVLNVCDLTYVGSYVFTGANGDGISGPFTGTLTSTPIPGVFDNNEPLYNRRHGPFCQRDWHIQPRRTNRY